MKVVLLNSPLFRYKNEFDDEDSLPPIGLGYIATYLQNNGIDVEFIDAVERRLTLFELMEILKRTNPDFLASNIFTTNYLLVKELIESFPLKTHFIIGGLTTKEINKEIILWRTPNFLDIVTGDGELITLDIIKKNIKEKPYFSSNNRRIFKIDGDSQYFLKNISDIPLNRSLFLNEPILNHSGLLEANIISSRGCIYNCTFCAAARSFNKEFPVRERSEISIIKELNEIKTLYPETKSIRILDDLFLKSRNGILQAINIFSKFDFQWRSMAHVRTFNHVDQNDIKSLYESGCRELFIGIESGSPSILKSINKTSSIDIIIRSLTKIFKAKINVKGYFIFGFPSETLEDFEQTYRLACKIKKFSIKYNVSYRSSVFQFRPYHGTEIYRKLKKTQPNINIEDISPNHELSNLVGRNQFNFHGKNFSKVDLETIHDYICRTIDLNVPGKLSC